HAFAIRIVKGQCDDNCGHVAAIVPNEDSFADLCALRRNPSQADHSIQRWTPTSTGDAPHRRASLDDLASFLRNCFVGCEIEPNKAGACPWLSQAKQRLAAVEERLIEADEPIQPCLQGVRQGIGVLANDEMTLLQA